MSFNTLLPDIRNIKTPVGYGAIMYNGSSSALSSCYPFFTSQYYLNVLPSISSSGSGTISIHDTDDYWTVMPGYKLEVYSGCYTGLLLTGDNTTGIVPVNYAISPANNATSIKLYFKGNLIDHPGEYDVLSNGTAVTASNYATAYDIRYSTTRYHVFEFYTGSGGTLSFAGSNNVSGILCLLIGGGGGGGGATGTTYGSGGGGAGTFLTTTITAIPGATFTIKIGEGGAGGSSSGAGSFGSTSSIECTRNGQTDILTAGGGGSGGGVSGGITQGNKASLFGSTGGAITNYNGTTSAYATLSANMYSLVQTGTVFATPTLFAFAGGSSTYAQSLGVNQSAGGGGGGAGTAGSNSNFKSGGNGGTGRSWEIITSNTRYFAGGGGGRQWQFRVDYSGDLNGGGGCGGGNSCTIEYWLGWREQWR